MFLFYITLIYALLYSIYLYCLVLLTSLHDDDHNRKLDGLEIRIALVHFLLDQVEHNHGKQSQEDIKEFLQSHDSEIAGKCAYRVSTREGFFLYTQQSASMPRDVTHWLQAT